MHRRAFLAAAAATAVVGCSDGRPDPAEESTPTVTPAAVPDDPAGGDLESAFGSDAPCPADATCFHRIDTDEPDELVLAVDPERFAEDDRDGDLVLRNYGSETWTFESDYRLMKYTGHRWAVISRPRLLEAGSIWLAPGDRIHRQFSIENTFGVERLGEGRYVCLQRAYVDGREVEGADSVAALFEVEGAAYEPVPTRDDVDRRGGTIRVGDLESNVAFVLERHEQSDTVTLVPEVIGARSVLRETIPRLGDGVTEVRAYLSDAGRGFGYLQQAVVEAVVINQATVFEFDGIPFQGRVETNR